MAVGAVNVRASGRIVLAATPLGNPADASDRLRDLLASSDVVAAEDTRRLRRLASALGVQVGGRVVSYYDANERDRARDLVDEAERGAVVAIVTDAGMPAISDPGYRVVAEAIDRGIPVTVAPGPSAVLAALAVSGLPVDRFCFEGFLPRKHGERTARIAELVHEPRTMVFFEAPHRVHAALGALAEVLGSGRRAVVCRELTKTYEEVRRGTLGELLAWAREGILGECTIVVAGASASDRRAAQGLREPADWSAAVQARIEAGMDRRQAITEVAKQAGVPRRLVYEAALRIHAD